MSLRTNAAAENKRYKLAIQSVFILRENILFLKEWLAYHIEIGVEHFYLYDNTGSIGFQGSSSTENKYGIPFVKLTEGMSDEDITGIFEELRGEFPGRITYVRWTPRDARGNIVYNQAEAVLDYAKKYGNDVEWTCLTDIDEFLFSANGRNLLHILGECERNNVADIRILQKKFGDRFLNLDKYVIQIEECIDGINTDKWAPKHILRTENIDLAAMRARECDIHTIPTHNGIRILMGMNDLRFNHYNTNSSLLQWMKGFYNVSGDFVINGCDEGMKRYWPVIEEKCEQGKGGMKDLIKRFSIPVKI